MKSNHKEGSNETSPNKKSKDSEKYSMISTEDNSLELIDIKLEKEEMITAESKDDDGLKVLSPIEIERNKTFYCKRIGNTFAFVGDKEGNPWFIVGPHWPMYFCFNGMVTCGYMLFFWNFWSLFYPLLKVFGVLIYGTFSSAYTAAFVLNPGYPLLDNSSKTGLPRNEYRFCSHCKIWVSLEKQTTHCADCDICVEGNNLFSLLIIIIYI